MKLKFCAGGDCPLWALAALHAGATLPSAVHRRLVEHVAHCTDQEDVILEILKDTPLNNRAAAARLTAVTRWVLHNAWRTNSAGDTLARDLHVLGTPRAHAAALAHAADLYRGAYLERAAARPLLVNRVTDVTSEPAPPGSIDVVALSLRTEDASGRRNEDRLLIPVERARTLLNDLKKVQEKMDSLGNA